MRLTSLLITVFIICVSLVTEARLRSKDEETTSCENVDDFECEPGICITKSLTCNFKYDCESMADESVEECGCLPIEFRCSNSCIPLDLRCDGKEDCDNGDISDEDNCDSHECLPGFSKCDNHLCVSKFVWCDFIDDCGDGSDEAVCFRIQCWNTQFTCDNLQCVNSFFVCDGTDDCLDGSDETNCTEADFTDCGDGTRVHSHKVCDGYAHCPNETDEAGCICDFSKEYQCNTSKCIPRSSVCNRVCDCLDCEDEVDCEECNIEDHIFCPLVMNNLKKPPLCLRKEFICDGVYDCINIADELGCPGDKRTPNNCELSCGEEDRRCLSAQYVNSTNCHRIICLAGASEFDTCPECEDWQFKCSNGGCVNMEYRCDNFADCFDGSDEENCESFECQTNQMKCAGGACIWDDNWCNYIEDCYYHLGKKDLSDEANCTHRECNEDEFRCKSGECIKAWRRCYADRNDYEGCKDKSHLLNCGDFECPSGTFKCRQSHCLELSMICNRDVDCIESWSDEADFLNCSQDCSAEGCNCTGHIQNCDNLRLNMELLDISNPQLRSITRFHLAGNHFSFLLENEAALKGMERMVFLDLSDNQISLINSKALMNVPFLHSLLLADNYITVLRNYTFQNTYKIKHLKLNGNHITTIEEKAFLGLNALTILDLSDQNITSIYSGAFEGLSSLSNLILSGNYLRDIPQGAFFGLNKLTVLDLSNNRLESIDPRAFYGLPKLRKLHTDAYRFCCMAKHVEECTPRADEFSSCEDLMANVFLRGSIWVIGLVASVGNLVVIMMRMNNKRDNRSPQSEQFPELVGPTWVHSFFIINLAIGDFCMGVYLLIIAAVDAYYRGYYIIFDEQWRSSGLCQFAGFLSTFSSELSVFSLTIITLHRLFSILFPFRIKDMEFGGAVCVMVVTWLMVIFLSAFPLTGLDYFGNFYGRSGVCLALHITPEHHSGWEYSVLIFLVLNFVSFATIALSYTVMFVVARKTQRAVNRSRDAKTGDAMARRMTLIVMTDFVCWIPIILLGVASLGGAFIPSQVYAWIAVFVLPINSAVNPMLYTLLTAPYVRRVLSRARTSLNLSLATMTTDMKQANPPGERQSRLHLNGRQGWKQGSKLIQSDANKNAIKLNTVTAQSDTEPDEPAKAEEFTPLRDAVDTTDVDEDLPMISGSIRRVIHEEEPKSWPVTRGGFNACM